ncbi:VOC family protein [Nocardia sp. NPDC058176]|uniref:VOC family protein n=1 Tax=Nocardia sp. NPDC058176 TaxID=3346368 RepID=UPI0036DB72FE
MLDQTVELNALLCRIPHTVGPVKILKTYARLFVTDLDRALPVYERLVGAPADLRFRFEQAEIAAVGDFLVVAGSEDAVSGYRGTVGPVIVDDLDAATQFVTEIGGEITSGPIVSATGRVVYARHPDGAHVEYVEWTAEVLSRVLG